MGEKERGREHRERVRGEGGRGEGGMTSEMSVRILLDKAAVQAIGFADWLGQREAEQQQPIGTSITATTLVARGDHSRSTCGR